MMKLHNACRLLREYVELEFQAALGSKLSFPLDVERVVDDIVLFCMLVGNDFLPGEPYSATADAVAFFMLMGSH
jgi:5'-3' exoribonuclease 1